MIYDIRIRSDGKRVAMTQRRCPASTTQTFCQSRPTAPDGAIPNYCLRCGAVLEERSLGPVVSVHDIP